MICLLRQGSPSPGPWSGTGLQPVRNRAAQQVSEASSAASHRSHYCLDPLCPPPRPAEKSSSTKPVPGAKKVEDRCVNVVKLFFKPT